MNHPFENLRKAADQWRECNPESVGGVVLAWEGQVYGWKDRLRDAHCEQPGTHAVDASGHVFIAEGSSASGRAKTWVALPEEVKGGQHG